MNPEKLRDTYGKLIYMLQDANSPELQACGASSWSLSLRAQELRRGRSSSELRLNLARFYPHAKASQDLCSIRPRGPFIFSKAA
eukprot:1536804-Pleurochrysis_carterae.AAC.1